jgi:hypothetical protein
VFKLPAERFPVAFNLSSSLGLGEIISSVDYGVVHADTGAESNGLVASFVANSASTILSATLAGFGSMGERYKFTMRATTSFGNHIERDLLIRIEDELVLTRKISRQFFEQRMVIENDFANDLINGQTITSAVVFVSNLSDQKSLFVNSEFVTAISGSVVKVQTIAPITVPKTPAATLLVEIQATTNQSNVFQKNIILETREV